MIRIIVPILLVCLVFAGSSAPSSLAQSPHEEDLLEIVDFRDISLAEAIRIFSLQTGMRVVPSAKAGKEKIDLFLSNVTPREVLSALAESYHFVLEQNPKSGITAIFLQEEAAKRTVPEAPLRPEPGGLGRPAELPKPAPLPKIALRGRILEQGRPPAVLLEIDGKLITLLQDSEVSYDATTRLRVEAITPDEVRILALPGKQMLVLY